MNAEILNPLTATPMQLGPPPRIVRLDRSLVIWAMWAPVIVVLLATGTWHQRQQWNSFQRSKWAALETRGQVTTARIKSVEWVRVPGIEGQSRQNIRSVYQVGGVEFAADGTTLDPDDWITPDIGHEFPVTYLPDNPSVHVVGTLKGVPTPASGSPTVIVADRMLSPPSEVYGWLLLAAYLAAFAFFLFGGIWLVLVLPPALRNRKLARAGTAVMAEITRVIPAAQASKQMAHEVALFSGAAQQLIGLEPGTLYELTFQFEASRQGTFFGKFQLYGCSIDAYRLSKGSQLTVLYDPNKPARCKPLIQMDFVTIKSSVA